MRPIRTKQNGWRVLLLALATSAFILLSLSCTTCPPPVEIPVDWPTVPDPGDAVVMAPDGVTVNVPLEYWLSLVRYIVSIERVREIVGEMIQR